MSSMLERVKRAVLRKAPAAAAVLAFAAALAACTPEVGSARWCEAMRAKSRADWTANEAVDFARHCLFDAED